MHWAPYLSTGREFEVIVDHKALVYLVTSPAQTENRMLLRYVSDLQGFSFSVTYQSGKKHLTADAVFRLFQYADIVMLDDEDEPAESYGTMDRESMLQLLRALSTEEDWINPEEVLREEQEEQLQQEVQVAIVQCLATLYLQGLHGSGCAVIQEACIVQYAPRA